MKIIRRTGLLLFVLIIALTGCGKTTENPKESQSETMQSYKSYFARNIDKLYSEPENYFVSNLTYREDVTEQFKQKADELYKTGDYDALWQLCQDGKYNIMIRGDTPALAYDFEGEPTERLKEAFDKLREKLSGYGMIDESGNNITERFVEENIDAYENGDYYELKNAMIRCGGTIVGS